MLTRPILVIDTETTSLDYANLVVWEIGITTIHEDLTTSSETFQVEVSQRELDRADQASLDINGFDERYNEYEAMSRKTMAHLIHEKTKGQTIATVGTDFDTYGLRVLMATAGLVPEWRYQVIDIRSMVFSRVILDDDVDGYEFGSISSLLPLTTLDVEEEDHTQAHTAGYDADRAAQILIALLKE